MAWVDIVGSSNLLRKTDFSAQWPLRRTTVNTNSVTAPDGTTTAAELFTTVDNNTHRIDKNPATLLADTQYTFSVYMKANGYNFGTLTLDEGSNITNSTNTVAYNLSSGTVEYEGSDVDFSNIINHGNGWYRCIITYTTSGSVSIDGALIGIWQDASTASFAGDVTKGILIWGPQLEIAASASKYVPRDIDAVSYAGSDGIWQFENTATSSNTYPDATGTYYGGVRTYQKPGGGSNSNYAKTRKTGETKERGELSKDYYDLQN